jgi:hypothetical protein
MKPVPKYWPKDQDKKFITWLYRAFRPDMDEFNDLDHPARHVPRLADGSMSDAERLHILRSIHKGSWERSPYLHCSLTVTGADSWHQMAVQDRGEERQKQVMCRLDLWNMYQQDLIGIDDIIDLSSRPAFQHFLLDGPDGKQLPPHSRLDFDHMAVCVIRSTEKKEVLLKWRGKIDACHFEVISDFDSRYSISGYSIGTLDKFIDRALWDHWEGGYDHGAILKEKQANRAERDRIEAETWRQAKLDQDRKNARPRDPPGSVVQRILLNSSAEGGNVSKAAASGPDIGPIASVAARVSVDARRSPKPLRSPRGPPSMYGPSSEASIAKPDGKDGLPGVASTASKVAAGSQPSNAATPSGPQPNMPKHAVIELGMIDFDQVPVYMPSGRAGEIAKVDSPAGSQPAVLGQGAASSAQTPATPVEADTKATEKRKISHPVDLSEDVDVEVVDMPALGGDQLETTKASIPELIVKVQRQEQSTKAADLHAAVLAKKSEQIAQQEEQLREDHQNKVRKMEQTEKMMAERSEQAAKLSQRQQEALVKYIAEASLAKLQETEENMEPATFQALSVVHSAEELYITAMREVTRQNLRQQPTMFQTAA